MNPPPISLLPLLEHNKSSIQTHDELLLSELLAFYENKDYLRRMAGIINGKRLSLRLLDWFVCNYSKEYYTMYEIQRGEKTIRFKVYIDYKTNLDIYSKKRFAPFCRHERIYVPYDDENLMETTLGQLNFFRWVFKNYLLEFIESHYEDIKRDMDARNTSRKRRSSSDKSSSSLDSVVTTESIQPSFPYSSSNGSSSTHFEPITPSSLSESCGSSHVPLPLPLANLTSGIGNGGGSGGKTRKKREELSKSACRSMRFERSGPITIKFGVVSN
jgi:hypothetical protein